MYSIFKNATLSYLAVYLGLLTCSGGVLQHLGTNLPDLSKDIFLMAQPSGNDQFAVKAKLLSEAKSDKTARSSRIDLVSALGVTPEKKVRSYYFVNDILCNPRLIHFKFPLSEHTVEG